MDDAGRRHSRLGPARGELVEGRPLGRERCGSDSGRATFVPGRQACGRVSQRIGASPTTCRSHTQARVRDIISLRLRARDWVVPSSGSDYGRGWAPRRDLWRAARNRMGSHVRLAGRSCLTRRTAPDIMADSRHHGRIAQWQSTCLTSRGSQVQTLFRPPGLRGGVV